MASKEANCKKLLAVWKDRGEAFQASTTS
jgi:hypothetical protein